MNRQGNWLLYAACVPIFLTAAGTHTDASVITETVISEPRVLMLQTQTSSEVNAGDTVVSVKEAGFFVGADIVVGGEPRVVAAVNGTSVSLNEPLSSNHAAGATVIQKPVFSELTVSSHLTVKRGPANRLVQILGGLNVPRGGVLEAANALFLVQAGDIVSEGSLIGYFDFRALLGSIAVSGQNDLAGADFTSGGNLLIGSAIITLGRVGLGSFSGSVVVSAQISAREIGIAADDGEIKIDSALTADSDIHISGGHGRAHRVITGSLTAGRRVEILLVSGDVDVRGPITVTDFGSWIVIFLVDGNVTTGQLITGPQSYEIGIFRIGGSVHTGALVAGGGSVGFSRVGGSVTTGAVTVGDGYFSPSFDISYVGGSVVVGGSINSSGVVTFRNIGGSPLFLGPIHAFDIVEVYDIDGDVVVAFPVSADRRVFVEAANVYVNAPGSIQSKQQVHIIASASVQVSGEVKSEDEDITIEAPRVTMSSQVRASKGTLCVAAPTAVVDSGAELLALDSLWVGSSVAFAGTLTGSGDSDAQSTHLFRGISRDALNGSSIVPAPLVTGEVVQHVQGWCNFRNVIDVHPSLTSTDIANPWTAEPDTAEYHLQQPVFRGDSMLYTVNITNRGFANGKNLLVRHDLPRGVTVTSHPGDEANSPCTAHAMDAGDHMVLVFTVPSLLWGQTVACNVELLVGEEATGPLEGSAKVVRNYVDRNKENDKFTTEALMWRLVYYALGDSVAAGHGLPCPQGRETGTCRQSCDAYPHRVRAALAGQDPDFSGLMIDVNGDGQPAPVYDSIELQHFACSGANAVVEHPPLVFDPKDFPEQVEPLLLDLQEAPPHQLTLVSITLGANDFDFVTESTNGTHLCAPDPTFGAWVAQKTTQIGDRLTAAIDTILSKPLTFVVVTDYYNPYNKESAYFDILRYSNNDCRALQRDETSERRIRLQKFYQILYSRTDTIVNALNSTIELAVRPFESSGRVRLAAVRGDFDARESASPNCGKQPPSVDSNISLIQYPKFNIRNLFVDVVRALFFEQLVTGNDCFHPTETGHAVYARGVGNRALVLLPCPEPLHTLLGCPLPPSAP